MDKWLRKLSPVIPPSPPQKPCQHSPPPVLHTMLISKESGTDTHASTSAQINKENQDTNHGNNDNKRHCTYDDDSNQNINSGNVKESESEQEGIPVKKRRQQKSIVLKTNQRRALKFAQTWLNMTKFQNWLEKSVFTKNGNEYAHCKICNVDIIAHKIDLTRHGDSVKHKANAELIQNTKKIPDMTNSNNSFAHAVRRAELKLCGLLTSRNLPFLLMDTLSPLCANLFPDSKIAQSIAVKRTKATTIIKNNLGENFCKQLFDTLKEPGCFFSAIMDETTDVGSIKQCAITVLYYCESSGYVVTRFFDIIEMKSATADNLWNCLKHAITDKNIPLINLVGFSADTCNVMFGEGHSVFTNLKKELPQIVCIKCSCHLIHLAASKACLKLPRSVEDLLRNLGSHFNRSYLRQEILKEFQQFFKVDLHKILTPAITRWLSLKACVDRVLEQYEPLVAYLRNVVFDDPSKTTEEMLQTITNKFTKIYLEFMSYILGLLTDFNILFQSESPLLHRVKPETERLLKNIYGNYLEVSTFRHMNIFSIDPKDPRNFVPIEKMYLGILATESIHHLKVEAEHSHDQSFKIELNHFFTSCLSFYIELASQIKTRFKFKDDIFDLIDIVDPATAQAFKKKTLFNLLQRFPILLKSVDKQSLDNEWRQHALLDFSKYDFDISDAQKYWKKVLALKTAGGELIFPNLSMVIRLLLVLPYSNASVERVFSDLRNIKTDHRNKLSTSTIAAVIHTKQGIDKEHGIVAFEPSTAMLRSNTWINKK